MKKLQQSQMKELKGGYRYKTSVHDWDGGFTVCTRDFKARNTACSVFDSDGRKIGGKIYSW